YGMMARAYFIYGCPQESWQTIQQTIDLIDTIKPLSAIFYILDVFPGTALYQDYQKKFKVSDDIWLNRIEDIMYFETDPALSRDLILAFGQKLRASFYEKLPGFVEALRLIDRKELYPQHSDFFSRLAMTFEKGDYAGIDVIPHKKQIAEKLYRRSLEYGPKARAYLGLGMIYQKEGAFEESIRILLEGVALFPEDESLHICLAVSYMNTGKFKTALSHLLKFQHRKEAIQLIANCYEALDEIGKAEVYFRRYQELS
ncbi:MAG: B12-binding domain-containing radical SAM protein, partial [Desulfobacterales bacterium]|nr:B12-binding domain-containing radical SAM protein [Desulfobacterales bacterium]